MPRSDPTPFDRLALTWDRCHGPSSPRAPVFLRQLELLRRLCRQHRVRSLLDIGCGTGRHLLALGPELRLGVGLDRSPAMVARARLAARRRRLAQLRFEVASAEGPWPAGRFDLLLLAGALEHFTEPGLVLRRVRDRLAPGGRALVILPLHRGEVQRPPMTIERLTLLAEDVAGLAASDSYLLPQDPRVARLPPRLVPDQRLAFAALYIRPPQH